MPGSSPSTFQFISEHVQTKTVKMLNGDLITLELNPFNFPGVDREICEVTRIFADTIHTRPHRVYLTKPEEVQEEPIDNHYDYVCLVVPPTLDKTWNGDHNHAVITISTIFDMYDFIDFFADSDGNPINVHVLDVHFQIENGSSGNNNINTFFSSLARHFHALEMHWWSRHFSIPAECYHSFPYTVKFVAHFSIPSSILQIIVKEWSNLRELHTSFDIEILRNSRKWNEMIRGSNIDTLAIVYTVGVNNNIHLQDVVWAVRRHFQQFELSIHHPYITTHTIILNRVVRTTETIGNTLTTDT
jgi:hypothetical protein